MFNSFQERQPNTDNIISAKLKLNEFFLTYLSQSETTQYIHDLLNGLTQPQQNNVKQQSPTSTTTTTTTAAPVSPSTSPYKPTYNINNMNEKIVFSLGESTNENNNNNKVDLIMNENSSDDNETTTTADVTQSQQQPTTPTISPSKQSPQQPQEQEEMVTDTNNNTTNNVNNNIVNTTATATTTIITPKQPLSQITIPTVSITSTSTSYQDSEFESENESDIENNNNKKLKSEDGCVVIQQQHDNTTTHTHTVTTTTITNNTITTTTEDKLNTSNNSNNNIKIPQFYFPKKQLINDKLESSIFAIKNRFQTFKSIDNNQPSSSQSECNTTTTTNNTPTSTTTTQPLKYISSFDEFEILIRELHSFPKILNRLLFIYILKQLKLTETIYIPQDTFIEFWKSHIYGIDAEDLLFNTLKKSDDSKFLFYEDFFLFSKTLIDFHPGLEFLANTPEFQDRYQETIIIRIFYGTCRNKGRITSKDLKTNNFIRSLNLLDAEPDINKHLEYFSYEHFYVIYCKFWELDNDHDLFIDRSDLAKYGNCSLTTLIIDRIIKQSIFTKTLFGVNNKISYQDFVWFILSEEDKTSDTSIEFWFSCVDLDCDGFLSLYEMDTFYMEQKQRLDYLNLDPPVFKDLLCQMLDMIKPGAIEKITLLDLKSSKMSGYLFNVLFNINKFLHQESKESISIDQPMSDWNRFALQEYERALAEESLSYQDDDQGDDEGQDEDDDDQDDDDDDTQQQHQHLDQQQYNRRMVIG